MAVRFDNATERLTRTADLPSFDANYTMMAWIYIATHPGSGNAGCIYSIDDQTDDVDEFYVIGQTSPNMALGIVVLAGGTPTGAEGTTQFATGTWQHVCIVRSANNLRTAYLNGVSHKTNTANVSGRTAPTRMSIGSVLDADLLNGRIAHVKIWTAALTAAEIQQEMYTARPQRTADLHLFAPLWAHTDLADYSGNGRTLTAVGTLATEDGPPVGWGAPVLALPFVAASDAQTVTANLIASAATTHNPTVTRGAVAVAPSLLASTAAIYAPIVTQSAITVAPAQIASAATVYGPVVTRGAVMVAPNRVASTATTHGPSVLARACIGGVLTVNSTNGRYVANTGGIVVLTGFHTWYDTQDGGATDPPPAFDWAEFLAAIVAKGCNFTKLWRLETAREWPSDDTQVFGVQPYLRTGPGNAADGKPKFDLDAWNPDYFTRLLERCVTAGNAGVYVAVQFFNGFHVDNTKNGTPTGDPWAYHPFQAGNNINSIDGDTDDDGIGEETRSTASTAIYNRQKAYIERVIDTLNALDNVIWEISNEDGTYSVAWQHALIDHIHTYEATKAKRHLVGMTKIYPGGSNSDLTSSNADWISPDDDLDPDAVTSTAIVRMFDTDHAVGITDTFDWAMRAFCRGYGGAWYMDLWDSGAGGADDTRDDPTYELIRSVLGYIQDYAVQIDLEHATPQGSLASTGYCLAKTSGSYQFFVYQDSSGNFTLNLSSYTGIFSLEWLRLATGATQAGSNVNGGAIRTLTPPWSGEVAALLAKLVDLIETNQLASTTAVSEPTVSRGAVTVAPGQIAGAATVLEPTITRGDVVVVLNRIAGTAIVAAPSITPGAVTVGAGAVVGAAAVFGLTVMRGAVTLSPSLIASAAAVFSPTTARGAVTVSPDRIGSAATVLGPAVTVGAAIVGPVLVEGTAQIFSPTATRGAVAVTPGPITGAATVFAPTISCGAVTVSVDRADSAAQIGDPIVTCGPVIVVAVRIDSTIVVFGPTVTGGALVIVPARIESAAQVAAPAVAAGAVTVDAAHIASAVNVPVPAVSSATLLAPARVASAAIIHAPTVMRGSVTIVPALLPGAATVREPVVRPGAVAVTAELAANIAAVHDPAVTALAVVAPERIASSAALFGATVVTGTVTVAPAMVDNTAQVFNPVVNNGAEQNVAPASVVSTAVLFVATVTAIAAGRIQRVTSEARVWAIAAEVRILVVED